LERKHQNPHLQMSELTAEVKHVPLGNLHTSLGAKMVPFAGFLMPVRYTSDIEEHLIVRNGVGMFDVSHMGEFLVEGVEAQKLVQWVTSNDVSVLTPGKIQYSCLPNAEGGIVDDLLVYCYDSEKYLLVVNAGNIDKDWTWINSQNSFDCKLTNLSESYCLFAVQGPKASEALQTLTSVELAKMVYYTFEVGNFAGVENVIISATGYTGAGGFELYIPVAHAEAIWHKIMDAGKAEGIQAIGLGARDTLRLEMGFCLYGNDIDDTTSPLEAGLGWITKLNTDFEGKDKIVAGKEAGLTKKLSAFVMEERAIPRSHYKVCSPEGEVLGEVTSGTQSPSLGYGIGMAYLPVAYSKPDTEIALEVRGKMLKAKVVKLPFLKK